MDDLKTILLIDDSNEDQELIREALTEVGIPTDIRMLTNGEKAMNYFDRMGRDPDFPIPQLILLDISLPRISGIEILKRLKNDPVLCMIPVLVLSTSTATEDISNSYRNHANAYIVKPFDFNDLIDYLGTTLRFWFSVAGLPEIELNHQ